MEKEFNLFAVYHELISLKEINFSKDFVSISSLTDKAGTCLHSGFIICVSKQVYYYHYRGDIVVLENITNDLLKYPLLFIKKIDIITELDTISFLGHCEKLQKIGVKPSYGFVFNNSYYDVNKDNFLVNAKHDFTTCVGFCIKVIRGFLYNNDEYLKIDDWSSIDISQIPKDLADYFKHIVSEYSKYKKVEIHDLYDKDELKRITPCELLCSGFFNELPIRKSSIDKAKPQIEEMLVNKKVA
ncbi:hypothetical protein [Labilibaculum euxinus]